MGFDKFDGFCDMLHNRSGLQLREANPHQVEASAEKDGKVIDFEPSELAETIEKNGEGASLISVLEEIQTRYR